MNPGAESGQDQFGNRDKNSSHPLIADTEDLFSVCTALIKTEFQRQVEQTARRTSDNDIINIIGRTPLP